ncbi:hypothetical protein B0H10DRAFT_1808537, partial [Mycena sp. CBHHK59/15]
MQLQAHVAYAALELAVGKLGEYDPEADNLTLQAKKLLQKCAHSMIAKQELSAQQVVSYLMDFEDHFTSHKFKNLYWTGFEKFINDEDPCPECYRKPPLAQTDQSLESNASAVPEMNTDMGDMSTEGENFDRSEEQTILESNSDLEEDEVTLLKLPHIEASTHMLHVCSPMSRKVPVPIGPAMPRRDMDDLKQKHAQLMLILFKPWRHACDLRNDRESWVDAYLRFCAICSQFVLEAIDNIQVLHECKDSRDAH